MLGVLEVAAVAAGQRLLLQDPAGAPVEAAAAPGPLDSYPPSNDTGYEVLCDHWLFKTRACMCLAAQHCGYLLPSPLLQNLVRLIVHPPAVVPLGRCAGLVRHVIMCQRHRPHLL